MFALRISLFLAVFLLIGSIAKAQFNFQPGHHDVKFMKAYAERGFQRPQGLGAHVVPREPHKAETTTERYAVPWLLKYALIAIILIIPLLLIPFLFILLIIDWNTERQEKILKQKGEKILNNNLSGTMTLMPTMPRRHVYPARASDYDNLVKVSTFHSERVYVLSKDTTIYWPLTGQIYHPHSGVLFNPIHDYSFKPTVHKNVNMENQVTIDTCTNLVYNPNDNKLYERCLSLAYNPDQKLYFLPPEPSYTPEDMPIRRVRAAELPPDLAFVYSGLIQNKIFELAPKKSSITAAPTFIPPNHSQVGMLVPGSIRQPSLVIPRQSKKSSAQSTLKQMLMKYKLSSQPQPPPAPPSVPSRAFRQQSQNPPGSIYSQRLSENPLSRSSYSQSRASQANSQATSETGLSTFLPNNESHF